MDDQKRLRRTKPFDEGRAHAGLGSRAYRRIVQNGELIEVAVEPLMRRGIDGLEQPIRVRSATALSTAIITIGDMRLTVTAEPAGGSVRFFIPAQSRRTVVELVLHELDSLTLAVEVSPVRNWEVSLVHHSHFDIGYTDLQSRVIVEQLGYLDDALRLAEASDDQGPSAFRWSVESIWLLREWIARRPQAVVERLIAQVRRGRIELAAMPFNMHTEACSTEELHGLLRYAIEISEQYGLEIPVAYQTDVPGMVAGSVDALADAGVKYLAVAHNWAGRSVPYLTDGAAFPRLFRWASPSGKSILVWLTTSAQGLAYQEGAMLGFHDSIDVVEDRLPVFLLGEETDGQPWDENCFGFALGDRDFDRAPYPWNEIHIRVMGRVADNSPPNRRLNEIVEQWNERWVSPKLEVATSQSFFEKVAAAHNKEVPTFTGDWNNWWADGLGSGARQMKMNREAQAAIPQATTIFGMLDEDSDPGFTQRIDTAWQSVELFDEHTWGAATPWTHGETAYESGEDQWHWKAEKAIRAQQDAWLLTQETLRAYANRQGGAQDASVWVINTAGVARGGGVSAFLPESLVPTTAAIQLVDPRTGTIIPFVERNQLNPNHRAAGRFVEFLADNVPATASRRWDVRIIDPTGRPAKSDGTLAVRGPVAPRWQLDNGIVRVEIDPHTGAIASIEDLHLGTELINRHSAFGFNAYVHDELAARGHFNHLSGFVSDFGPDLALLADRTTPSHVAFEDAGSDAVSEWIRFRIYGTGVESIITTIRLTTDEAFVDIENRVRKRYQSDKESAFFAFPFNIDDPIVRYEVTGSIAGTGIETVPGGAQYVHAVRDWVALHHDRAAVTFVTRDAPLVQIGDIALPFAPFPGTLENREPATVFSWIHNNVWDTNFPSGQAFDMSFRYRIAGLHSESPEHAGMQSAQVAENLIRPLLAVAADPGPGDDGAPPLVVTEPWVTIDDSRVRLLTMTRVSGKRMRAAIQSVAESEIPVRITTQRPISSAWETTLQGIRKRQLDITASGRVAVLRIGRFGTGAVEFEFS